MCARYALRLCLVGAIILAQLPAWSQVERQIPRPDNDQAKLNDPLEGRFRASQTTQDDQSDISVTIYNNNLALVRDQRNVALFPGVMSLNFMDVAEQIKPETVSLRSITSPGAITILEQNYEFDLMSPQKLMEKYVGQNVRLINYHSEIGFSEVQAELLSVNQGPIYRIDDEIYLGHPGNVVLPEVPENLIAQPTLVWLLNNEGTDQEIEVTYLTQGISWKADYVLSYDEAEGSADLDGWVTLNNQSGAAYVDANLKVVAGDVNIVQEAIRMGQRVKMLAAAEAAAPMVEEAFAEYHLYTLPRRTTIKQNQSKQVNLLNAAGLEVAKHYEFRGQASYFYQKIPQFDVQPVSVHVSFENAEDNNLGMPLPAGIVRVYQQDTQGTLQFAGEDNIQHTPKDETVRLRLGNAFDVVGERTQTDFTRLSDRVTESAYEVKLRNHKESAVRVDIIEPIPGDWSIQQASHQHEKRDAQTAVFEVGVDPDEEVIVTYRVRVRY